MLQIPWLWGDPFDQRHCTLVHVNHSTSLTHVLEEEEKQFSVLVV